MIQIQTKIELTCLHGLSSIHADETTAIHGGLKSVELKIVVLRIGYKWHAQKGKTEQKSCSKRRFGTKRGYLARFFHRSIFLSRAFLSILLVSLGKCSEQYLIALLTVPLASERSHNFFKMFFRPAGLVR